MKHSKEYIEDLERFERLGTKLYTLEELVLEELKFKVFLDIRELLQKMIKKKR